MGGRMVGLVDGGRRVLEEGAELDKSESLDVVL